MSTTTTSSRENRQLVLDAWATFATRDPVQVGEVFAEHAEWWAPPENATALALDGASQLVGRERIVRFLTEEFGTVFVTDVALDFRAVVADEAAGTVVVELRLQATLFNGRRYDNDYCFVFELSGGLITRLREYMDTKRGALQFGP